MIGCGERVLLLLCLAMFEMAQTRVIEFQLAGNDGPIGPTPPPAPPTVVQLAGNDVPIEASQPPAPSTVGNSNAKDYHPTIIEEHINREISEDLYEADIVLTPEQKLRLQERKATRSSLFWPKDSSGTVTVGYRFGDDIINRTMLKLALAHWEHNTCIRFKEAYSTVDNAYLKFVNADYCASYVGRLASSSTGQNVWLHPSCIAEVGPAVHEIGHALGFYHEQSRSDRDDHVNIILANVQSGKENNFKKEITHNYGVPYDYYSVMHYGPRFFSTNDKETIIANDLFRQPLMGNRIGLSFADKRLANTMYGCIDKWLTKCSITNDPCQNLGYTGPVCNCVCPEGTSGLQCQVLQDSYTDALVKLKTPYSKRITTEGVVSTPGYPTPIQNRTKFVKVLVAPECHRVKLIVVDFDVHRRNTAGNCAVDGLTILESGKLGTVTPYCDKEIAPGTVFKSKTNTIVLDYYNYNYVLFGSSSRYRGFNATIQHVPVDGCIVGVTFINSGNTSLIKSSSTSGSCYLGNLSVAGDYRLMSQWYPFGYWPGSSCSNDMETNEPRYLKLTATEILFGSNDAIVVTSLFGAKKSITTQQVGNSYVFPSSSVNIFFKASSWWFGRRFKLSINVLNSDCHQIVRVVAGVKGNLTKTNYAADTVCEWWIQAPVGRQIKLDFTAFDVGKSDCSADYLAIGRSGDRRYSAASQQYCGRNSPGSVTSTGMQLNMLLNGHQGGHPGFSVTYSVV